MDIQKLAKLMMRATSSNDNEALTALRMANSMLDSANLTWEQFIAEKTIVVQEVMQTIAKPQDPEVEQMLSMCLAHVRSASGRRFIQSLNDWYSNKGFLTERQKEALRKWYDNI